MISKNLLENFPSKNTPRQQQIDVLKKLNTFFESDKKFAVCCLPTGSGKSHIAMSCATASDNIDQERYDLIEAYEIYKQPPKASAEPPVAEIFNTKPKFGAYILTVTKNLQDQYKSLFQDSILLKGKANYQCTVDPSSTADSAPCLFAPNLKKKCFSENKCPYYTERRKGFQNKDTITNYRAYLSLPDFLKNREVLICDEASNLEEELVSFYSVTITYSALQAEEIPFKKLLSEDTTEAYQWLCDISVSVESALADLNQKFALLKSKKSNNFEGLIQKFGIKHSKLSRLSCAIGNVISNWHSCQYIVESKNAQEVMLVPLNIKPLALQMFNKHNKVILMSATISNHSVFTKMLGIEKYSYIEMPSPFDAKKSPIICSTKYNLSYQNIDKTLPYILDMVVEICKEHKGHKGLIHTHTHSITQALRKKIKNNSRFLFREPGSTNEEIIQTHRQLNNIDTIIVSPSLDSGVSLDDELGRFQIIIKAPFLPLGSKRIKRLFDKNPDYYMSKMLDTLVQMCGRCTRSNKDYSITYILDGTAVKAIKKHKDKLPLHFLDRFK